MVAGEAKSDLWWLIIMVVVLGLVWLASGGPSRPFAIGGPFLQPPAPLGQGGPAPLGSGEPYFLNQAPSDPSRLPGNQSGGQSDDDKFTSPWRDQIRLRAGNGRYEIQPNREYLTIEASFSNKQSIAISGWRITSRLGSATIPQGVKVFIGGEANPPTDPVTLEPGGRATIVTGQMANSDPFPINASFQVNRCAGYLEALPNWQFVSSLATSCPRGSEEPWLGGLSDDCYEIVTRWQTCHTPKFERRADGYDYFDGRRDTLTSQCREFIKSHFNYNGCVAFHRTEPDFLTKDWQVYLRQWRELASDQRETISLYDNEKRLVDQISY